MKQDHKNKILDEIVSYFPKAEYEYQRKNRKNVIEEVWLFYNSGLLIKKKDKLIKLNYSDLTVKNDELGCFLHYNYDEYIYIKKEESNKQLFEYIFNNPITDNKDIFSFDINKSKIKKPNFVCTNNLSKELLRKYFGLPHIYYKMLGFYFFIVTLLLTFIGSIIIFIPKAIPIDNNYLFFFISIVLIAFFSVKINMKKYIKYNIQKIMNYYTNQTLYIYDDFLLVNDNRKLELFNFKKIKCLLIKDNYVFIAIKDCKYPIIVSKKEINIINFETIKKHIYYK